MNEIWQQISSYIMPIITVLLSSGLGAVLVRTLSSSWFKKHDLSMVAKQFADKLAGSKISLDIKAVTEKQLGEINKKITKQLEDIQEKINMILTYQGDTIACISSSAKLKETEVAKLLADCEGIKQAITPIEEKQSICLEIQDTSEEKATKAVHEGKNLINFN